MFFLKNIPPTQNSINLVQIKSYFVKEVYIRKNPASNELTIT